jgi:hypothetical protein
LDGREARVFTKDRRGQGAATRIHAVPGIELIDRVDCAASHASIALAQAKASAEARFKLAAKIRAPEVWIEHEHRKNKLGFQKRR